MGALAGNTGMVKFNSYSQIADGNCSYNWGYQYGNISKLAAADASGSTWLTNSCTAGDVNTGLTLRYPDRILGQDISIKAPIGAISIGFQVQINAATSISSGDPSRASMEELFLYKNGNIAGSNKGASTIFTPTTSNILTVINFGGSSDMWGMNMMGSGIMNNSGFGIRMRAGIKSDTDNTGLCPIDYLFMNIYWKQTGCLLGM